MTTNPLNAIGPATNPRIALITPVRDEEEYVEAMICSIVEQQTRPLKWLIVDDGSTDKTPNIVRSYCRKFEFIELLELPVRSERRPGGEGAVAAALQKLNLSQYNYLARFDADLLFESDYFARLIDEFEQYPTLGIAGGGLYVYKDGELVPERAPSYHVRGALKMYRRECFEELGGLSNDIGWDTIDEVYSWSRGWRTRSFCDIRVIHRRPTGSGLHASRVYRERGRAEYLTWSHPVFVLLKAGLIGLDRVSHAWCFFCGFLDGYVNRRPRLQDRVFKRTRRSQQLSRMLCAEISRTRLNAFSREYISRQTKQQ